MHYDHIHDVMDLNIHQRKQIEYFFLYYKKLEGKHVEINGFEGKDRALEIIKASAKTYQQKYH
jgi:inorganic pyrophosphatase